MNEHERYNKAIFEGTVSEADAARVEAALREYGHKYPIKIEVGFYEAMALLTILDIVVDKGIEGTTPEFIAAAEEWFGIVDRATDQNIPPDSATDGVIAALGLDL